MEETFQTGKGLAGLDEHQVRRWTSWHRWVTLAMLAHAFLAVAAPTNTPAARPGRQPDPLTCNEIQHLFITLSAPPTTPATGCAGPPGDAATSPRPAATTGDKPCGMKITIYGWSTSSPSDPARCRAAGVPGGTAFATKPRWPGR